MGRLDGKVAIVTGAGRGIGRAIADRFRAEGARLALLDHGFDASKAESDTLSMPVDVTDEAAVDAAIATIAAHFGRIDIVVNNAAAESRRTPVADLTLDSWRRTIDVNLTGVFLVSRAALRVMRPARSGVIVNIASQLGSVAVAEMAPYCASKGGVIQLTRTIALDHAADGIRANALSPGAVMTQRLLDAFGSEDGANAVLAPKHPMGRVGLPEEIAAAAVFLASDESTFMTGSDMIVDGGYTAQ